LWPLRGPLAELESDDRREAARVSATVACYIGAAYWFTASTSFANPAVTIGRMFSESFAGIAPASVPGFVIAELAGSWLAAWTANALRSRD
jgi:glycerol uptake facilitator-like aquaporin